MLMKMKIQVNTKHDPLGQSEPRIQLKISRTVRDQFVELICKHFMQSRFKYQVQYEASVWLKTVNLVVPHPFEQRGWGSKSSKIMKSLKFFLFSPGHLADQHCGQYNGQRSLNQNCEICGPWFGGFGARMGIYDRNTLFLCNLLDIRQQMKMHDNYGHACVYLSCVNHGLGSGALLLKYDS